MNLQTRRPAAGPRLALRGLALAWLFAALSACTVRLVQPHDDRLVSGNEDLFRTASQLVDDGYALSPRTDAERAAIRKPADSDAHYAKFEPRYDALIRDSDLLILRAMAGSGQVDPLGDRLQAKIEQLIEQAVPSVCQDLKQSFDALGATSLTVRNFVDLKCLLTRWKDQHADDTLTRGTGILKKANWEGRRQSLFRITLAIERAEASKQP